MQALSQLSYNPKFSTRQTVLDAACRQPVGFNNGGATRDRTADLLHAMQALSQLSYNPKLSTRQTVLDAACRQPVGFNNGGATRDRTADLLHAMQALSQLSYNPTKVGLGVHTTLPWVLKFTIENLVELRGIEPRTSCMPCKRSPS